MAKKAARKKKAKPSLDVMLVLDRTGSMESSWKETIHALNAYARKVLDSHDATTRMALTVFDSWEGRSCIETVRPWMTKADWQDVGPKDYPPRGMTPLFDAFGGTLSAMRNEKRPKSCRCQLVVMTDGLENASREWTKARVKRLLTEVGEDKNWSVIFLGADFDAMAVGADLGTQANSTATFDKASIGATTEILARHTKAFGLTGQSVSYSAAERAAMSGTPKRKKGSPK